MIADEIQQRDEALTAQGHDPECAAFDDRDCSCEIGGVEPAMRPPARQPRRATSMPAEPAVTLVGLAALALAEYQGAAKELKATAAAHQRAQERYQRAHQAFADAMADG